MQEEDKGARELGILQKFEMMGRECNLDREESEDQRTYIHSFVHLKINILEHLLRGRTYSRT